MGKGLKGFKDYRDYLSYAQVCLSWMDDKDHQKLYEMLLKRKGEIELDCTPQVGQNMLE